MFHVLHGWSSKSPLRSRASHTTAARDRWWSRQMLRHADDAGDSGDAGASSPTVLAAVIPLIRRRGILAYHPVHPPSITRD